MAYDQQLDARVSDILWGWGAARRKMFGGTGYMLRGHMMAGVWGESLIVRLSGEEGAAALELPHVRPFDISKNPMSGWVMVDGDTLEEDNALIDWLARAREYVDTLPEK